MAYEKVSLVIASLTGDVYMSRINEDGTMDERTRRIVTDDVIRASAEWFIANKKALVHFKDTGWLCWIPENENVTSEEVKEYLVQIRDTEGSEYE